MKPLIYRTFGTIALIGSLGFGEPAFAQWSAVKAIGEANSAPELQGKCQSSNNAVLGAIIGGAFGNQISEGSGWATAAGAAVGGFIGGLFGSGGCPETTTIVALVDPVYKYPELWSSLKAHGVRGSSPFK